MSDDKNEAGGKPSFENEQQGFTAEPMPSVGQKITMGNQPAKRRGRPPKAKVIEAPASAFDLAPPELSTGVSAQPVVACWIGLIPEAPIEFLTIGGVSFPKQTAQLVKKKGDQMRRPVPKVGAIAYLTRDHFTRIRAKLRKTVFRFDTPGPDSSRERHRGLVDFSEIVPRKGRPITAPTAQEIRERGERGLPVEPYTPSSLDEPVAAYVYLEVCENQASPERGSEFLPRTLAETGLPEFDSIFAGATAP